MIELSIKRYLKIIILFPIKLVVFLLCTIFIPLIWVFEDELSFYDYFLYWRDIFLEKESIF